MMRAGFLALALLVFACSSAWGKCTLEKADIPVSMDGPDAMATATINGKAVRLKVDSGAFFSTLDEEAAKKAGLHLAPAPVRVYGIGGAARTQMTTLKDFTLAGFHVARNKDFLVTPNAGGSSDLGLLGEDVLSAFDVEYDLANGMVRLLTFRDCEGGLAYWSSGMAVSAIPLEHAEPGHWDVVGPVIVNGQKFRAVFDTGATRSLITLRAAERAGVRPGDPGVRAYGLGRGIGPRSLESWVASFANIQLGDEQISNTQLTIEDADLPGSDMLIGADFFLSHRVLVARSQNRLYFTYNGGPVFRLDGPMPKAVAAAAAATPPISALSNDPADAAGFERRGMAEMARREYATAIADFTRAVDLDPARADAYFYRAGAKIGLGKSDLALGDLDTALKLKPDMERALTVRARVHIVRRERLQAEADLGQAVLQAGDDPRANLGIASLYAELGDYAQSLTVLDRWLAANPDGERSVDVLLERSRIRTQSGQELDKAVADCDLAARRGGRTSEMLTTRAMVQLRQGDLKSALGDYDAALKLQPKFAAALYGRGLTKEKLGLAGQADLVQAAALDPNVTMVVKAYGVTPEIR